MKIIINCFLFYTYVFKSVDFKFIFVYGIKLVNLLIFTFNNQQCDLQVPFSSEEEFGSLTIFFEEHVTPLFLITFYIIELL